MTRKRGRPFLTQHEAENKMREACGAAYDFKPFVYHGSKTRCELTCHEHGSFTREYSRFVYNKNGCPRCGHIKGGQKRLGNKNTRLPAHIVKSRLNSAHGDTCRYDEFQYINATTPGKIVCVEHGEFWQSFISHTKSVYGCPSCEAREMSKRQALTFDEAVRRARLVHGNRYEYPEQPFVNVNTPLRIVCSKHGEFWQAYSVHVYYKSNCPECANVFKRSLEEFVTVATLVHDGRYDYSRSKYVNGDTKIEINCPSHGVFWQRPDNHLNQKHGCPRCSSCGPSKLERKWLTAVGIPDNVEHRQVMIPGSRWIVDGKVGNALYEFYGSYWHGDPRKWRPDDLNQRNGRHMGSLYHETIERQCRIRELGFELKYVWEIDYRAGLLFSEKNPHE